MSNAMKVHRHQNGTETWNATTRLCASCEIGYLVTNAKSKQAAILAVMDEAPSMYGTLYFKEVRFESYSGEAGIELTAIYTKDQPVAGTSDSDMDEPATLNFDCTGATKRLNYAISQRKAFGSKDAGLCIGWNGKTGAQMEIAGVDVPTGSIRETYDKNILYDRITTSYKRMLRSMVGKVNNAGFKGWAAGEVMFLGATFGTPVKGNAKVKASFYFLIRENEEDAEIDGVPVGKILGHEYLWAIPGSKRNMQNAAAANVDGVFIAQVARYVNFGVLGL